MKSTVTHGMLLIVLADCLLAVFKDSARKRKKHTAGAKARQILNDLVARVNSCPSRFTARPKVFCSLLFACLLAVSALAQQTHTTVRHYKERIDDTPLEIAQAEDAIQKNDFAAAETLLKKAIDKDPKNYQAWFDLGFVLNRVGRTEESIHAYRQSVAAKPDVFESNLNLGLMLVRVNNPDGEQFLRAATGLKPTAHVEEGQARAWLALAHLLENTKPEDALRAYRKASELTPKDPEPHLSAGLLHERRKEFSEAEYKQALTLDPRSADSHDNDPQKNDPHNHDSHTNDPATTEAAIGLTNIYMKSNRLGDAEPLLRKLAAERADDSGIHLQLGRVLEAEGKKDEAIAEFQTVAKLAPADSDAQRELADLYSSAGKNDLAETAYRALVAAQPKDPELHHGLGRALLLQKKFPEAEQ